KLGSAAESQFLTKELSGYERERLRRGYTCRRCLAARCRISRRSCGVTPKTGFAARINAGCDTRQRRRGIRAEAGVEVRRKFSYSAHVCRRAPRRLLPYPAGVPAFHGGPGASPRPATNGKRWRDLVCLGIRPHHGSTAGL